MKISRNNDFQNIINNYLTNEMYISIKLEHPSLLR